MSRYTYSMGTWTQGSQAPEWEGDEEYEIYIERLGYSPIKSRIGHEHGASFDMYTSTDGDRFLASVSPDGNNVYEVFITDFPSLMLFLKDFGPTFSLSAVEIHQDELREMMEKLFNAYHGHGIYEICKSCAPIQWSALKSRKPPAT